ncbi:hypothetical protein J1614_000488 [Plenodomus biglobosus]|nr:hypothetical protein J1614_000488 [Plenodomus biglobosus]
MKSFVLLAAACASVVVAEAGQMKPRALITIEVAPGETRQITEDERWELSSSGGCGNHFFDISTTHAAPLEVKAHAPYPSTFRYTQNVKRLFPKLNWDNIRKHIEHFTTYPTRFSDTVPGEQSAQWLLAQVKAVVSASKKPGVTAEAFPHANWPQDSIVVRIPGRSNKTVIVGAHLDSVNGANRTSARAPGADDNASGSFTILEALRVLLTDRNFAAGQLQNTVEFHWYAAEEGGLRGSQDIFTQYAAAGRDVWAMLNQDMTGYTEATFAAGAPESFGLITDFTDAELNEYVGRVIGEYTDITFVESTCGYACSDHGSATRSGYPSSFVFEAAFEYRNPHIHTKDDTIEHIDSKHVLQHGQLVLGFIYELGFTKAT